MQVKNAGFADRRARPVTLSGPFKCGVLLILTALLSTQFVSGQNATGIGAPAPLSTAAASRVRVFVTDPYDTSMRLSEQTPKEWGKPSGDADTVFTLDPKQRLQTMDGFGASMTESAAHVIFGLPDAQREELMQKLFNPQNGLGISLLRQPMGASDFAVSIYSYDDMPPGKTDPELVQFSIDRDRAEIIPLLKRALAINPDLKIIASPWSPPAWMKSGGSMIATDGGALKPEYFAVYARYFVRFIQAYRAEGLRIYGVTPQNEINYGPSTYPGMMWAAKDEGRFVRDYLAPGLKQAGLNVKIMLYDHNWDHPEFIREMFADKALRDSVAGSAWHYYAGNPAVMSSIHQEYPDKDIWFTEGGSGIWIGSSFRAQFKDGMQQAVNIVQNWAKSVVWWNIALDQTGGPVVYPNTVNLGLVTINSKSGNISQNACYYTLGHLSAFVRPGAYRMGMSADNGDIQASAFVNPDGTKVMVFYNRFSSAQTAGVSMDGRNFELEIPGDGAATCIW